MGPPAGAVAKAAGWREALGRLPRNVWLIGLISLVNDSASELIYPLLPLVLTSLVGQAHGPWVWWRTGRSLFQPAEAVLRGDPGPHRAGEALDPRRLRSGGPGPPPDRPGEQLAGPAGAAPARPHRQGAAHLPPRRPAGRIGGSRGEGPGLRSAPGHGQRRRRDRPRRPPPCWRPICRCSGSCSGRHCRGVCAWPWPCGSRWRHHRSRLPAACPRSTATRTGCRRACAAT